jgi:POT family proton-dependent oligopeptide transporter
MLIGLVVYLSGRKWLPVDARASRASADAPAAPAPKIVARDIITVLVLVALLPVMAISALGNQEIFNAYLVWGDAHLNLVFAGQSLPVTWLISFDAFISTATIAGAVAFWRWWATRWREPDEITKLWIGAMIAASAPLFLAIASLQEAATGHKVGMGWALAFHVANDIGYANIFPVGLALFSRAAPRAIAGFVIGVYYLHLFMANMLVGWIGGLLEKMSAAQFWFLHAGLVATGAVIMLLFSVFFGAVLAPKGEPD